MTDFMERARAEAERERHALYDDEADPFYGFSNQSDAQDYGFTCGAEWARDVLLADPTDGEVEVVARASFAAGAVHAADTYELAFPVTWDDCTDWDHDHLRLQARAAITAFLAERRGSE